MKKILTIALSLLLTLPADMALAARKRVVKPIDPQKELKDKLNRYFNGYRVSSQVLRNRSKLAELQINDSLRTIEVSADTHFGEQVFTPESVSTIYDAVRALMPDSVADYQLIIPKEELQKTIAAEIKSFEEEKASKNQNDEA